MRARENALFDPGMHLSGEVAADGVDQAAAYVAEALRHHPAQCRIVLDAHMLEHSDRNKGVVLAGDVAIVIQNELDGGTESFALRAFARKRYLLFRDVERADFDAVVWIARLPQPQPASTTLSPGLSRILRQT
jgi:hypothetical protein